MGDMADYYNELQEEGGRYFPCGDPYRVRYTQILKPPSTRACNKCGVVCEWHINDSGKWQLYSLARGEHNRKIPHQCGPSVVDDFEDLA